jgi:hypothetical protein
MAVSAARGLGFVDNRYTRWVVLADDVALSIEFKQSIDGGSDVSAILLSSRVSVGGIIEVNTKSLLFNVEVSDGAPLVVFS